MADSSLRGTNPLIVAAATAVILTCLLAIGVMTGIVPSPLSRDRGEPDATVTMKQDGRTVTADARLTPKAPAREPSRERLSKRQPGEPVGNTASSAPSQTVAGGNTEPAPPPKVAAVCTNCGTVTSVRAVKEQKDASMIGPAVGAAAGGLLGNQIGSGSGNKIATIAGAAIGAGAGTEVERRVKATTHYVVGVRLNDGTTRTFNYQSAPGVHEGDKVRIVEGRLVRDS